MKLNLLLISFIFVINSYIFTSNSVYGEPNENNVPKRYENIIPRIGPGFNVFYSNLFYEGNNIFVRGAVDEFGLTKASGAEIANRWRFIARRSKGLFVLRDSLFSQQDHPYQHRSYSPLLPPNWVTAALIEKPLIPLRPPDIADNNAWMNISSIDDLFGSFPKSESLFEIATKSDKNTNNGEKTKILNARFLLHLLSQDAAALIRASKTGPLSVVSEGARRISLSDRRYFGTELRCNKIIPIFVENPTKKEILEGKGMSIPEKKNISKKAISLARRAIYARRLEDGDMAIERYDISSPNERNRAINLLEELIPKKSGHGRKIWLWITGPGDREDFTKRKDASEYIDDFLHEIKKRNVNLLRLRFVSKPSVKLPTGKNRRKFFEEIVDRYSKLGLSISLDIDSHKLKRLLSE
jgi:hypothetical protein